jgi:hypothetical protein
MWNENKPLLSGYFFRGLICLLTSKAVRLKVFLITYAFPDARNKIVAVWKKSSNCEEMLISIGGIYDLTYFVELIA